VASSRNRDSLLGSMSFPAGGPLERSLYIGFRDIRPQTSCTHAR